MPSNSTGTIAIFRDVSAVAMVTLSPQETGVRVRAIPAAGGTIVNLPGNPFPNDGDAYDVADADGSCSANGPLIVMAPPGTNIRGASDFVMSTPFSSATFVFDSAADAWIAKASNGVGSSSAGPLPVMLAGDSIIYGITDGAAGANPTGQPGSIRNKFFQLAAADGSDMVSTGPYLTPPILTSNNTTIVTGATPERYAAAEYWHAGNPGDTIEQLNARIGAQIAALPAPPFAIVNLIGTNDCGIESAATMLAAMTTLQATERRAAPSAHLSFSSIPMVGVANEAVRDAFNAGLPAVVASWKDSMAHFVDGCPQSYWAGEPASQQGFVAGPVRDGHPTIAGGEMIGKVFYDHVRSLSPVPTGAKWPRALSVRPAQTSILLQPPVPTPNALDAALIPDFIVGKASWAVSFDMQPQAGKMPTTYGTHLGIIGFGSDGFGTTGMNLVVDGSGGSYGDLLLYVFGTSGAIAYGALDPNTWSRIVISGHAADEIVAVWVNGTLVATIAGVTWNWAILPLCVGPMVGFNGLPMYVDNIEVALGANVPAFRKMRAAVQASLAEQVAIPGRVGLWRCDEVAGGALLFETGVGEPPQTWEPTTFYAVGTRVQNGAGLTLAVYECTGSGVSAGAGGPTGTGTGILDGAAVWQFQSQVGAFGLASSAAFGWTLTTGGGSTLRGQSPKPTDWNYDVEIAQGWAPWPPPWFATKLGAWLEADGFLTSSPTTGATSLIKDASGQAHNAVQAVGAAQPIYSQASGPSGRPALTYDGIGMFMLVAAGWAEARPVERYVVAKFTAAGAAGTLADGGLAGNSARINRTTNTQWTAQAGIALNVTPYVSTAWNVYGVYFDAGANSILFNNGVQANAGNVGSAGNVNGITIGAFAPGIADFAAASIAGNFDVVVELLASERAQLGAYLRYKYGTP